MVKNKLLITVCAAALAMGLGIGAASAEGSSWEGYYAGVHTGYGQGDLDFEWDESIGSSSAAVTVASDIGGGLVGIHGGYNWAFSGNLVAGVEADIDYLIFDWDAEGYNTDQTDDFNAEASYLASLRARLGVDVGGSGEVLVYVTGGVAVTNAEATFHAGQVVQEKLDWDWGGVIGAGVEHIITERLAFRAEGLYYWFGEEDWICRNTCTEGLKAGQMGLDAFTLRVGLTYQLGTY